MPFQQKYSRFHFMPYQYPTTLVSELSIKAAAIPKKSPIHQPTAPAAEETISAKIIPITKNRLGYKNYNTDNGP